MFRKLQLSYAALKDLWEVNLGYFSNDPIRRKRFFGATERPDFLEGRVAEAKYFGSYTVGGKGEIEDFSGALSRTLRKIEDADSRKLAQNIIQRHNGGGWRFYDDKDRVYIKGYEGVTVGDLAEQWFVRLPKMSKDAWSVGGADFPILGEVLCLYRGRKGSSTVLRVAVRSVDSEGGGRVATRALGLERIQTMCVI